MRKININNIKTEYVAKSKKNNKKLMMLLLT